MQLGVQLAVAQGVRLLLVAGETNVYAHVDVASDSKEKLKIESSL